MLALASWRDCEYGINNLSDDRHVSRFIRRNAEERKWKKERKNETNRQTTTLHANTIYNAQSLIILHIIFQNDPEFYGES